jgi:hypothetical protein
MAEIRLKTVKFTQFKFDHGFWQSLRQKFPNFTRIGAQKTSQGEFWPYPTKFNWLPV